MLSAFVRGIAWRIRVVVELQSLRKLETKWTPGIPKEDAAPGGAEASGRAAAVVGRLGSIMARQRIEREGRSEAHEFCGFCELLPLDPVPSRSSLFPLL